jgi:hypothetical protein
MFEPYAFFICGSLQYSGLILQEPEKNTIVDAIIYVWINVLKKVPVYKKMGTDSMFAFNSLKTNVL